MCEKIEHWTKKTDLKIPIKLIAESSSVGRKIIGTIKYIIVTFL